MKPPVRERRKRILGLGTPYTSYGNRWTLTEKQQLLQGLQKHGPYNLELIQKNFVPARPIEDIQSYITSIRNKYKGRKADKVVRKAPIETWLEEAEALCSTEGQDYSFLLSEVFSVFGNVEPHDLLPHGHAPNWREVYLYISALLRGAPTPYTTPSNAMVILSLIDSLVLDLRNLKAERQRELMKCKHKLLKQAKYASSKSLAYKWLRDALDEDPLEARKRRKTASDPQPGVAADQPSTSADQPSTSADQPSTSADQPSTSADQQSISSEKISNNKTNNEHSTSRDSDQSPSSNAAPKSRGKTMYTINPFCVPIKYLKLTPKS